MKRQWFNITDTLPEEGQKVYYFCNFLGIFRGEYHFQKNRVAIAISPHTFVSSHGILDADEVTHWMPYDHALRDMIPLPPDYKKVDIRNQQSIMNSGLDIHYDEIEIPQEHKEFSFNYILSGEIQ